MSAQALIVGGPGDGRIILAIAERFDVPVPTKGASYHSSVEYLFQQEYAVYSYVRHEISIGFLRYAAYASKEAKREELAYAISAAIRERGLQPITGISHGKPTHGVISWAPLPK